MTRRCYGRIRIGVVASEDGIQEIERAQQIFFFFKIDPQGVNFAEEKDSPLASEILSNFRRSEYE